MKTNNKSVLLAYMAGVLDNMVSPVTEQGYRTIEFLHRNNIGCKDGYMYWIITSDNSYVFTEKRGSTLPCILWSLQGVTHIYSISVFSGEYNIINQTKNYIVS